MMRQTICLAFLLPVFLAGCESADPLGPEPQPDAAPPANTTRARLATPRDLAVVPADSQVDVTATRNGSTAESGEVAIAVRDGSLELATTPAGDIVVQSFELALDDVVLSPTVLPPDGLTLTDISVRLAQPALAQTTWESDDVATADATVDLDFDWAILGNDGEPLPLGVQHVTGVAVTFEVTSDADGHIVATLGATRDGRFWDWADIVELSDLRVSLSSVEPAGAR